MRNYAIVYWKKVREISAVLFGFIEEYLSGTEDIRANGTEAHVFRRLYQLSSQRLRTDYDAGMANVRLFGVMMGIFGFLDVFSGTGTISFTEKTQPEYLFRTLLPQCVSIMRLP